MAVARVEEVKGSRAQELKGSRAEELRRPVGREFRPWPKGMVHYLDDHYEGLYRVRDRVTGAWWQGAASSGREALQKSAIAELNAEVKCGQGRWWRVW